ncbi:MAG: type II secretion system F family protein [Deltaproteobacteria bacterium]|nr:type II secretion system F family protein [Deltaproteobacteria bacterium]
MLVLGHIALFSASLVLAGLAGFFLLRGLYPDRLLAEAEAVKAAGELGGAEHPVRRAVLDRFTGWSARFLRQKRQESLKKRFLMMGAPHLRPVDFITYQQLSAVFFLAFGLLLLWFFGYPLWASAAFMAVGLGLPHVWLNDQIKRRHKAVGRELPYALDLLTLSVEAGLDFASAVGTVVQRGMKGALHEELSIMLNEIRMGKTREEALRNLGNRVGLTALTQFVSNLIQADRMGTSLGKVLRIQATQMRIDRTHRAEKLAGEAPVKLLFPLILCIFPTVFLILFGPIAYRLLTGGE